MDQLFVNVPSSIHAPPQTPQTTWNTLLENDEYEDDVPASGAKKIRRRSSKGAWTSDNM